MYDIYQLSLEEGIFRFPINLAHLFLMSGQKLMKRALLVRDT